MKPAALALALLAATVGGCGQKGPLTLPDQPRAAVPVNPDGTTKDESGKEKKPDQP
jgi:predicted small lipoprotein YifL